MGPAVGIFVDYESPLAREVARNIWAGLSAAALGAGYVKTTALWESLRASTSPQKLEGASQVALSQDLRRGPLR